MFETRLSAWHKPNERDGRHTVTDWVLRLVAYDGSVPEHMDAWSVAAIERSEKGVRSVDREARFYVEYAIRGLIERWSLPQQYVNTDTR